MSSEFQRLEQELAFVRAPPSADTIIGHKFKIQYQDTDTWLRIDDNSPGCGKEIAKSEYVMTFEPASGAMVWEFFEGPGGDGLAKCKFRVVQEGADFHNAQVQTSRDAGPRDDKVLMADEHKLKVDTENPGKWYRITGSDWNSLRIRDVSDGGGVQRASTSNDSREDSDCFSNSDHLAKVDRGGKPSRLTFHRLDDEGNPLRKPSEILADMDAAEPNSTAQATDSTGASQLGGANTFIGGGASASATAAAAPPPASTASNTAFYIGLAGGALLLVLLVLVLMSKGGKKTQQPRPMMPAPPPPPPPPPPPQQ